MSIRTIFVVKLDKITIQSII